MQKGSHCSAGYHEESASDLAVSASNVQVATETNSTLFPASPVTKAEWLVLIAALVTFYGNYKKGGINAKPDYITSRGNVMAAMDKTAFYVESIALGDSKIIIKGGYIPTSITALQKTDVEIAPEKVVVKSGTSTGISTAYCETFGPDHNYGCVVSEGQPLAANVFINPEGQLIIPLGQTNTIIHDINKQREKKFSGLKKGVDYYYYFYVVNTIGASPLSTAVMLMSI